LALFRLVASHLIDYPTPVNLNPSWNWGSLAGLAFVWQLVSGIFLAKHFGVEGVVGSQAAPAARSIGGVDHLVLAGPSGQRVLATVMRDVPFGRWLRIAHANGGYGMLLPFL
jgi:ubiquinol-cytochrome c reductase cytochrome b subunit